MIDHEATSDAYPGEVSEQAKAPSLFQERLKGFEHIELRRSARINLSPASNMSPPFTAARASSSLRARSRNRTTTAPRNLSSGPDGVRPRKPKRKPSSGYTQPARYEHLRPLPDVLTTGLICVFVGVNPGIATSTRGHAYAHPSNLFWKLLHSSGLTNRRLRPEEDQELPRLYSMGYTNIVGRPTRDQSELSKEEMVAGTAALDTKFLQYKPEAVVIVGKGIWEAIWKYRYGRTLTRTDFHYGWQEETENMGKGNAGEQIDDHSRPWEGARVFVATSTSGLSAGLSKEEKEAIWKPVGEWVEQRRSERLQGLVATKPESDHWLRKLSKANTSERTS